jgi:hypothetical protein
VGLSPTKPTFGKLLRAIADQTSVMIGAPVLALDGINLPHGGNLGI